MITIYLYLLGSVTSRFEKKKYTDESDKEYAIAGAVIPQYFTMVLLPIVYLIHLLFNELFWKLKSSLFTTVTIKDFMGGELIFNILFLIGVGYSVASKADKKFKQIDYVKLKRKLLLKSIAYILFIWGIVAVVYNIKGFGDF